MTMFEKKAIKAGVDRINNLAETESDMALDRLRKSNRTAWILAATTLIAIAILWVLC